MYALDVQTLLQPKIRLAVARDAHGAAVGCGAIVLSGEYGEIKRMYVRPAARGAGTARQLMDVLEQAARTAGCAQLVLETGPDNLEAMALYTRHGLDRCGPSGDYPDDPLSVFMQKKL